MILSVQHRTIYRYDQPMRGVVQSHRTTPSQYDGQSIHNWDVVVSCNEGGRVVMGGSFRDGAGDLVQGCSIVGPVTEVVVDLSGTVETTDLTGVLRGHRERIRPEVYLQPTVATSADVALSELAREAVAGVSADDPLARAHRLSEAVEAAIVYSPGVTHAHTTAAESLALGEGVCQDHTHAVIAAALSLGMPARYVSGYLQATEAGSPHEAAHAWAEVWVNELGWVGFDASNGVCPDDRYLRLGSGRDSREAAPIRGIARGPGKERMDVSVAVSMVQH